MKYLFVIYTDSEYEHHLDHFKKQEFYRQLHLNNRPTDPHIEVIEWGADFHTNYRDLPTKTQEMMKWCSENKEYDYLIKCDDTIFDEKWIHYSDKLIYESIFKNDDVEYSWKWGDFFNETITEDDRVYYEPNTHWKTGLLGAWIKINQISDDYRGINLLQLKEEDWLRFEKDHDSVDSININFIPNDIPFFEGKFYMVSKDFSIFIGGQEKLAKELSNNFPVEDLMVGYLSNEFKSISSISR
jgi:hypothetical protein